MTPEDRFSERYREGSALWDIGKPDFNLVQTVTTLPIPPCKALEIGSGTGDNAIWLAQQGFNVVAVDASEIAIEKAKEKAARANVTCTFAVLNILKSAVEGSPFGFAFDRWSFHEMTSDEERQRFAEQVNRHLEENGLWLSLIGNADEQDYSMKHGEGIARDIEKAKKGRTWSATKIVSVVEPYFEILSLASSHLEARLPDSLRAWVCLMRRRRS